MTTAEPGNGHATDETEASTDAATVVNETTEAGNDTTTGTSDGATTGASDVTGANTLETITGTNYMILFSNGMMCAQ